MAERRIPFRVETPAASLPPRDPAGRFQPPAPPKVVDDARAAGIGVVDYLEQVQAPEHPTPGGKPHQAEERPPMRAVPPPKPPMRLK